MTRIDYPINLTNQGDFSKHSELIETGFLDQSYILNIVDGGVIPQGSVVQVGGVVYRADADENITGTTSDYVKIVANGATASAEYVADLTGVTWNKVYNGYYDGPGDLYLFNENKALLNGEISSRKGRYLEVDSDGRAKVAPPSATDDIARLDTVGPRAIVRLTSGSGNWTVPAGVTRILVTCVGGGGGGGGGRGGGSGASNGEAGTSGGTTTFAGATSGAGGSAGAGGGGAGGGVGGAGAGGSAGAGGGADGGSGGGAGGVGAGGSAGAGGGAGAFGGGGGGGGSSTGAGGGGGGGGGTNISKVIGNVLTVTPGSSIAYSVGGGGGGGDGGSGSTINGGTGGAGGSGIIIIEY